MVLDALENMPGGAATQHQPRDEARLSQSPLRAPEGTSGLHHFEDSRGEPMFYIVGGGEQRGKFPCRNSIRSPMFITIPYASKCMIGYKVADIPAIMGSFDPCIGETDR